MAIFPSTAPSVFAIIHQRASKPEVAGPPQFPREFCTLATAPPGARHSGRHRNPNWGIRSIRNDLRRRQRDDRGSHEQRLVRRRFRPVIAETSGIRPGPPQPPECVADLRLAVESVLSVSSHAATDGGWDDVAKAIDHRLAQRVAEVFEHPEADTDRTLSVRGIRTGRGYRRAGISGVTRLVHRRRHRTEAALRWPRYCPHWSYWCRRSHLLHTEIGRTICELLRL